MWGTGTFVPVSALGFLNPRVCGYIKSTRTRYDQYAYHSLLAMSSIVLVFLEPKIHPRDEFRLPNYGNPVVPGESRSS